jgi:hypothetical protein
MAAETRVVFKWDHLRHLRWLRIATVRTYRPNRLMQIAEAPGVEPGASIVGFLQLTDSEWHPNGWDGVTPIYQRILFLRYAGDPVEENPSLDGIDSGFPDKFAGTGFILPSAIVPGSHSQEPTHEALAAIEVPDWVIERERVRCLQYRRGFHYYPSF